MTADRRVTRDRPSTVVIAALLSGAALAWGAAWSEPPAATPAPTFADVLPIFRRACTHCHGGERPVEGLALDTYAGSMKGATGGVVVLPGQASKSGLLLRLQGLVEPRMPFDGEALPAAEIARIEAWIAAGAKDAPPPPAPAPGVPLPPATPPPEDPAKPLGWEAVAPILRANCVRCHQPKGLRGPAPEGLRFDAYDPTVGGAGRVSVLPGWPEASPLLRSLRGLARKRMPLDGPPWLPEADILRLERWIRDGARGPDGLPAPVPTGRAVRLVGRLEAGDRLDGLPFQRTPATRQDKDATVGATVELRAVVSAKRELVAERIRGR